jgi:hypothetical protein
MSYYSGDRTGDYGQMGWPKPGINTVGEYQMSGQPFLLTFTLGVAGNAGNATAEEVFAGGAGNKIVDDSPSAIHFPAITKKITYTNGSGADAYVYFCSTLVPEKAIAAASDVAGDGATPVAGNPTARGNRITTSELNQYHNGAGDERPNSAVKVFKTYLIVANGSSITMNVKCRKIFIAGAGDLTANKIVAELTSIEEQYDCDYRGLPGISGGERGSKFLVSQEA